MTQLIATIQTALPVFLALALGMLCRQRSFLSRDGVDTLKKVVINITLPAVLLQAFASATYTLRTMMLPVLVFLLCCLALVLGKVLVKLLRIPGRLAPFVATGFEAGMLGYALFALLFPQVSSAEFAILDLGQTLFVFTLFKILLSGKTDWKAIGHDMVTTPILWAVLVGVLIGATGLYEAMGNWGVRGIVDSAAEFVAAPTGMIILLTVGYDLVLREIPWKKTGGLVAMRLGVMAVVLGALLLLNRTVLNGIIFEGAAVLLVLLPPPYVIPVFADEPGERVQISSALSALTLLTMVLFAAYAVILGRQ
jgi:predicted permease